MQMELKFILHILPLKKKRRGVLIKMKRKLRGYIIYCVICLLIEIGESYSDAQAMNSFDGALSHIYSGFSLEIEDSLTLYP